MNITIIFKPTYSCFYKCRHCAVGDKKGIDFKVSEEKCLLYFDRIFSFFSLIGLEVNVVDLIWHGGEPMLMGVDFYYKVTEGLKSRFPNIIFLQGMQTNLMLYSKDRKAWYDLFKDLFEFRVGTSYDFFTDLRPYSLSSFLDTLSKYVEDSGNMPGVITMVTPQNVNKVTDILDLAFANGFRVKYNPVYEAGDAIKNSGCFITEYDYFRSMVFVYDYYKERYGGARMGSPFDPYGSFLKFMVDGNQRLICPYNSLCFDSIFHIDPFGNLYKCAVYAELGFAPYGNLLKDDLNLIVSRYLDHKIRSVLSTPLECKECEIFMYCGGGCVAEREYKQKGNYLFSGKYSYCDVIKFFYSKAKQDKQEVEKCISC